MDSPEAGISMPTKESLEKQRQIQEISGLLNEIFGCVLYDPNKLITIEPSTETTPGRQSTIWEAATAVISLREENRTMLERIKSDSRFETLESTERMETSITANSQAQTVILEALMTESERRKEEQRIQQLSPGEQALRVKKLIGSITSGLHTTQKGSNAS